MDPERVHPMPASDASASPEAAAADYAKTLEAAPPFDVCLLGMGPEGHIASLFPDSTGVVEAGVSVVVSTMAR